MHLVNRRRVREHSFERVIETMNARIQGLLRGQTDDWGRQHDGPTVSELGSADAGVLE